MKKLILGCFVAIALTGCVTPSGDMLNNKFDSQQGVTQQNTGYYTGSIGPYTVTLKVNSDGTGYSCESMGNSQSDRYLKVKFSPDMVYFSNGGRFKLLSVNNTDMTIQNIYFGMNTQYKLSKDDTLSRAAPFCEKQFK